MRNRTFPIACLTILVTCFAFCERVVAGQDTPEGFPDIRVDPKFAGELPGEFVDTPHPILGQWFSRHLGVGGWRDFELTFFDDGRIELLRSGRHLQKARYELIASGCLVLKVDGQVVRHVVLKRHGDVLFVYHLANESRAEELYIFTREAPGVTNPAVVERRHLRIQAERHAFADSVLSAVRDHLEQHPRSLPPSVGWLIAEEVIAFPEEPESPSFYRPKSLDRYSELRESPIVEGSSYAVAIRDQSDFTVGLAAGQTNPIIVWSAIHNPEGRHQKMLVGRVTGDWEVMTREAWQDELQSVKDQPRLN